MVALQVLRWALLLTCFITALFMANDFRCRKDHLNPKAREYYFGRFMWLAVGASAEVEGLIHHTPWRYTLVFLIVATLSTLRATLTKGPWGDNGDD